MPNIERLQQLRRVVLAAPDNELFDMARVFDRKPCGTAHCAYGWAKEDQWFRDNTDIAAVDGLGYTKHRYDDSPGIFDLSGDEASDLFDPPMTGKMVGSTAKRMVVENIDRIIAGQPTVPYPVFDNNGNPILTGDND